MNKTAIKNFAIWARNKLIADISYRAGLMGITADGIQKALPQSTGTTEFYDIGTAEPYSISGDAVKQRKSLVEKIRAKEKDTNYQTAYKYVIEEVAYTWFNRLIAVRFMEVNDYLPSHIRVLSSDSGKMEPDLVTTPFDVELSFKPEEEQEIYRLKQENKLDEVFRLLFIKQCNALNEILPALFEKTSDYTELLLNPSVIDQDGVIYHLVHDIPEADFNIEQGGQVEIIGWLYQYYNTELKNEAFAKSGKISKEEIPAVTQLFTPDWIVRYMVENSVGRIWIEHLRALDETKDEAALAADFGWKYYLPEAKQEPEVEEKLRELRKERAALTPEQITMIDPCMGSGHILVYGFSVLMQIYESAGYGQRDAAKSILEHNLFGLDIDDRAYQMAYFAVMMKAREYNRRILNGENACNVYAIQESNGITDAALGDMGGGLSEDERKKALKEIKALIAEFKDAKEYGSILNTEKRDWDLLRRFAVPNVGVGQLTLDMNGAESATNKLQEIIDIAEVMANNYFVAVTNPPYMAISNANGKLNDFVKKNYSDAKADLFSVFIERCRLFVCLNGYQAMITMHAWMFVASFEKLRESLLNVSTVNMAHLGARAFDEIAGEVVQTTAFVLRNNNNNRYRGLYIRLVEGSNEKGKERSFLSGENRCVFMPREADFVPGSPVAYWIQESVLKAFSANNLGNISTPRMGLTTGRNDKYLRLWQEVDIQNIGFGMDRTVAQTSKKRWFPYDKGGEYRKWYGNRDYVVDWYDDGYEMQSTLHPDGTRIWAHNFNLEYNFIRHISWNDIVTGTLSFRLFERGFLFDSSAATVFLPDNLTFAVLGYLNSAFVNHMAKVLNPTIHFKLGDYAKLPFGDWDHDYIAEIAKKCVEICKNDWDSRETSWDFKKHPFLIDVSTVQEAYESIKNQEINAINELIKSETMINEYFADYYSINDADYRIVDSKDVSVHITGLKQSVKSLLSYAIGCMFGRYSLSSEGLAYAGGIWDTSKYSTFLPDEDNVIPITDEEYLEDDIVSRLCTWMKAVFGESTLEANLDFIAKALGNKGDSSREVIRNYFLNDFFKDHCQIYSVTGSGKRPIYWLFDSGKQNGFKALIYLHRYNADIIGNLRIDYVHRMQRIYESEISRMQDMIDHSTNTREVAGATKRREKLQKQLKECREYDERLAHLALSRIELDLDDGVKVNYRKIQTANDGKFYEVLADSKNIMAKK